MNKKIGFIGSGNMAKAMIGGIINSGLLKSNMITSSALTESTLKSIEKEFGINTTTDSREVVKNSEIIVVAVKPNVYDNVLESV